MRAFSEYVGVPYVSHGNSPAGWDCLGLVLWVLREHFGARLPDYAALYASGDADNSATLLAELDRAWQPVSNPRPGDVLALRVMGVPRHVGVVVEPGVMLHAMRGRGTVLERLDSRTWKHAIHGAYRWALQI